VFHGVSAADFEKHYWPACKALGDDNRLGTLTFAVTRQVQRVRFMQRALLRMAFRRAAQRASAGG
jgi:hypothetical protein